MQQVPEIVTHETRETGPVLTGLLLVGNHYCEGGVPRTGVNWFNKRVATIRTDTY